MIIYHPYQNIYFNTFFNKNAHEKFEVDYWGLAGKKFLDETLYEFLFEGPILKDSPLIFKPLFKATAKLKYAFKGSKTCCQGLVEFGFLI